MTHSLRWTPEHLKAHRARLGLDTEDHAVRPARKAKYRNQKTEVGDRVFDSKLEAARFVQLKRMQEAGIICNLQCQVPFAIEVGGVLICKYIADFVYIDTDGRQVVEDAKGVRTREYIIKRKLMKAVHRIDIKEFRREKSRTRKSNPV